MRVLIASICDGSFLGHAKDHVLLSEPCLVYALQRARDNAEGAMTELNLALQQQDKEELQRRNTKKADVQRRLTNRVTEKSNQVKEDIKSRLVGEMPAQEKDKLSLQERPVLKVFEQYAKDDDSRIDRSEMHQVVQSLGAGLSEDPTNIVFTSIDTDQDGHIDFEEFFAWYKLI